MKKAENGALGWDEESPDGHVCRSSSRSSALNRGRGAIIGESYFSAAPTSGMIFGPYLERKL